MRSLVLAAGLLFAPAFLTEPNDLDAPDILERMGRTYAQCETYCDSGVVTTVFFREREGREYERTVRKPFATAFVRPDRFRYEFEARRGEAEFDRYLVWRRGADVRTWWDVQPGVETHASLKPALSGATGVSDGTANRVPTLLMPDEVGWNALTELEDPKRIGDAFLGQVNCHRIAGHSNGADTILWIDAQSYVLRRVEEKTQHRDFRTESTTVYEPEIDGAVLDPELSFDPPEERAISPRSSTTEQVLWNPADGLGPKDIVARMAKVYTGCASYRDTGVMTAVRHQERAGQDYPATERQPFITTFVRPDRFRYQSLTRRGEEEFDRYLVWCQADEVKTWWDVKPGVEESRRAGGALRVSLGTEAGAPNRVPELLAADGLMHYLIKTMELVRLEDADIGAAKCFRISLRGTPERMTLWIDQQSFLLLRIEETNELDALGTESTIDYEPEIDVQTSESELLFDPPS